MDSQQKIFLTPLGYLRLTEKLKSLEENIQSAGQQMGDLARGDSGDGYHDNLFLQLQQNYKQIEKKIVEVRKSVSNAVVIDTPAQFEFVAQGHEIDIRLYYPNNEDSLSVILVSPTESPLFSDFSEEHSMAISLESPIGNAIINSRVGDIREYKTPNGDTIKVLIKNIRLWNKGFSV